MRQMLTLQFLSGSSVYRHECYSSAYLGVIVLGTILAALLFDTLSLFEAAILGTILAATDAALGKAVVTNKAVPADDPSGIEHVKAA